MYISNKYIYVLALQLQYMYTYMRPTYTVFFDATIPPTDDSNIWAWRSNLKKKQDKGKQDVKGHVVSTGKRHWSIVYPL